MGLSKYGMVISYKYLNWGYKYSYLSNNRNY